jgi:hypothetical protein
VALLAEANYSLRRTQYQEDPVALRRDRDTFDHQGDSILWPTLSHDEPVALVNDQGLRLSGRVDTLTPDRSCLWIRLDSGMGRLLIHHQDGYILEHHGHGNRAN